MPHARRRDTCHIDIRAAHVHVPPPYVCMYVPPLHMPDPPPSPPPQCRGGRRSRVAGQGVGDTGRDGGVRDETRTDGWPTHPGQQQGGAGLKLKLNATSLPYPRFPLSPSHGLVVTDWSQEARCPARTKLSHAPSSYNSTNTPGRGWAFRWAVRGVLVAVCRLDFRGLRGPGGRRREVVEFLYSWSCRCSQSCRGCVRGLSVTTIHNPNDIVLIHPYRTCTAPRTPLFSPQLNSNSNPNALPPLTPFRPPPPTRLRRPPRRSRRACGVRVLSGCLCCRLCTGNALCLAICLCWDCERLLIDLRIDGDCDW